jgi:hypothetical protein
VINSAPNVWKVSVGTLSPPKKGQTRKIGRQPLIDLGAVQAAIAGGLLVDDDVWPATRRCWNSLEDYEWSFADVLQMFSCLRAEDYKESEWCDVDGGRTVPADVYTIPYDDKRRERSRNGLVFYVKFSIDNAGGLTLVLVQCHL